MHNPLDLYQNALRFAIQALGKSNQAKINVSRVVILGIRVKHCIVGMFITRSIIMSASVLLCAQDVSLN